MITHLLNAALMFDIACRQKWFHVYRIRLILSHDEHVGRHLHVPNASGKYNAVSCRQAADLVFSLLYRHASFVLIDKHTYVTLLYRCDISDICFMWSLLCHFAIDIVYFFKFVQSSNGRVLE